MTAPRAEKAYEKHAWILLFALGVFFLIVNGFGFWVLGGLSGNLQPDSGALKNFTGLTYDELVTRVPGIGSFVSFLGRETGVFLIGFSILIIAIARVSYKKGERWAWYVLWTVPALILAVTANGLSAGEIFGIFGLPFLIIALLGLLLPYRKFFPRK